MSDEILVDLGREDPIDGLPGRHGLSEGMNPHFGVRRREALEVFAVAGEDLGSSPLDGMGYDEGIHGLG